MERPDTSKKMWAEPRLIVHGNIEHITQQTKKDFGPNDGFTFEGQPIHTVS
jgi:hypothetical protein